MLSETLGHYNRAVKKKISSHMKNAITFNIFVPKDKLRINHFLKLTSTGEIRISI